MRILISFGAGNPIHYLRALAAAGGRGELCRLPRRAEGWDGLVLAGGGDVVPARYGQLPAGSRDMDPLRDQAELELLDLFLALKKPVLGICRGHQVAAVWAGGTLLQDLGERLPCHSGAEDRVHSVMAAEGGLLRRLYGAEFAVNSNHHQGVDRPGQGLRVTARSPDGVIEAMEHVGLPLLTVQFHPERMTGPAARGDTVDGGSLFRAFMELCKAARP